MNALLARATVLLIASFASLQALAQEPLTESYAAADKAFKGLAEMSNTLGMISYCQIDADFPTRREVVKKRIVGSFDASLPPEDRMARATILFSMVNMYAGGVARGLTISHTLNNSSGPDKTFCETAAIVAREIFPESK